MKSTHKFTAKQILLKELFVGTLIYAVVLGFLNDYTDIVLAKSFSTVFFSAIILQTLTMLALKLKVMLVDWFKPRKGSASKVGMFFSVWLVMFSSKFVFIWALDLFFGSYITISGFFGILLVAALVTAIHKLADYTFLTLGKPPSSQTAADF
jgi:hypothetical protein